MAREGTIRPPLAFWSKLSTQFEWFTCAELAKQRLVCPARKD